MIEILLPIVCAVLLGYLTFILVKAYRPDLFRTPGAAKHFTGSAAGSAAGSVAGSVASSVVGYAVGSKPVEHFTPKLTAINMPSQPTPSAAPPVRGYELAQEPRTVSPGGPGAPNARDDSGVASISPEAMPVDPFQDSNMEAPIKDSMRHPELSFGPGMDNSGIKKGVASGVMDKRGLTSESPFSPEFAQNGGQFMGAVTANDLSHDDTYATA